MGVAPGGKTQPNATDFSWDSLPGNTATCSYQNKVSFLYRYGDHRDLHSFPTRRSSDLPAGHVLAESDLTWVRPRAAFRPEDTARVDRKSTRLNSSHGSISYAVFCLK